MAEPSTLLTHAVAQLYAGAPSEFVATRRAWAARAREAGERETAAQIAALRRPSVAAWAVNTVVRSGDAAAADLAGLGARLRDAQAALDADALGALRGERDALLSRWEQAAAQATGGGLSASVRAEVRDCAVAALADEQAQEVVLSGALTRAVSYSGFGEVDVSDAVVRTSTGVVLSQLEGGGARQGAAQSPVLAVAEKELATTRHQVQQAESRVEAIRLRVAALREELSHVEEEASEAEHAWHRAIDAQGEAQAALDRLTDG